MEKHEIKPEEPRCLGSTEAPCYANIAMISGGKDSTAMAIKMVEEGWPVDEWVFCDTGKEFPAMYDHLDKLENYLGITLTRLKAEQSFEYYMHDHVMTKGKRKGEKGYAWPDNGNRWCTYVLKQRVTSQYLKQFENVREYHGIALDEAHRAEKNEGKRVDYPLLLWGMTEPECLQMCYEHGFNWDGLYEEFKRVSCYCCPLSSMAELNTLFVHYPELWQKMKEMDVGSWRTFKANYTLDRLERRFLTQNSQLSLFSEPAMSVQA